MIQDISEIIADENTLVQTVSRIADEINSDYMGASLVVVGVLKGSVPFLADLFRRLHIEDCFLDFISASSYGSSAVSSGELKIKKDLDTDVKDKHVLVVEDILDTGNTLYRIREMLLSRGAASVRICTLFDKPSRRVKPIVPDYCGMTIDDLFIVGYGLDYAERYRNLPFVGVLKPEIYT